MKANLLDDGVGDTLVSPAFDDVRLISRGKRVNLRTRMPCSRENKQRSLRSKATLPRTNYEPIMTMYQYATVDGANGFFREVSPKLP
jgi:hypothetical protein